MSSLKRQARIMSAVERELRSALMAEEAILSARLALHKSQIERTQARLDRIAERFGRYA